ncbi:MAG: ABC transporter permease, partial [Planctomyces sp.]
SVVASTANTTAATATTEESATAQPAAAATSDTAVAPVASVADGNASAVSESGGQSTGAVGEVTSPVAAVGAADESAGALPENPFGTGEENAGPASVQTGPLKARVILGEGIVSFQTENPRTGKLEKIMMVNPGDDVILGTVSAGNPPDTINFSATVVDTFRSGMNDLDTSVVLMNLEELQNRRGMIVEGKDAITSIHIRLKDYDTAPEVVRLLKSVFPASSVNVRTWEEKQGLLLEAVEVETAILNVLLFLIIAVAGFGILAIFFMIVVEKTRDIGILKSLGASSSGIMSIFLSYGLALGMVGSLAGVGIGLLFVAYINEIEDVLSWITGRKVFDEKIYYFHEIPTHVSGMMVFLVALGAITIAVLASVLPARRASRLHPVRALRFE